MKECLRSFRVGVWFDLKKLGIFRILEQHSTAQPVAMDNPCENNAIDVLIFVSINVVTR